jgi:hypothetical protein
MDERTLARFESKYSVPIGTGCWIWHGGRHELGYGRFWSGSSVVPSHRISYEHYRGPIPNGLEIDHLCRVHSCVNPWHLEPVTHTENVRRGDSRIASSLRGEAITHCKHGHVLDGQNTYLSFGSRQCRACKRKRKTMYRRRDNPNGTIGKGSFNAQKTHCPKGHAYNEDNVFLKKKKNGTVSRECRACWKLYELSRSNKSKDAA